jgi:hypothetical protein
MRDMDETSGKQFDFCALVPYERRRSGKLGKFNTVSTATDDELKLNRRREDLAVMR